jgi:hypothetical protein
MAADLPTNFRNPGPSHLLAATGRTCAWNRDTERTGSQGVARIYG